MLELTEKFPNENPDDFRLNDLMKEFHGKGIIKKRSDEEKRKNDEKRRMNDEAKRRRNKIRNIFITISLLLSAFALVIGLVVKNKIDIQKIEVRRQEAEIKHLGAQEQLVLAVKGKYLSSGKKTHFIPSKPEERIDLNKINGNRAFSAGQYDKAKSLFNAVRTNTPDDPEALIYSNNAEAFLSGNYLTIVASVPIKYSNDIAKEMLRGIAHAQDKINRKGGIKGELLHVVIADDNNDPADVDVIANYLISDKEVLAVVGSNASEATKQAANIYQGEMVMISPTSFAVNFNKIKKPENGKNYIFLAVNDYEVVMPKLVKHIKDTVIPPKLFVCDDSGAFDQNIFREYFTENGLSLVQVKNVATKEEILCDLINKEDSYEKIVEKAIQLGINSLFIAPHVSRISDGISLARHARAKNPDLILFGSPTLYNAITLMDGRVTTGLVIPAHWHLDVSQKHHFYQEAIELWGKQNINGITWRTAASYDAVYVISTALEKIDINDGFSRENLQLQLTKEDFEYEGALGEIHFKQNGAREESDSFLIKVEPCHENCPEGYEYSFYLTN